MSLIDYHFKTFFTPYSHFFHPTRLANFHPYSFIRHLFFRSSPYLLTTFPQIKLLTPYSFIWPYFFSFSTSQFSTLLVYLALLFYEICSKYPTYSFIWPYLFNWHLRVCNTVYINFFYVLENYHIINI